MGFPGDSDGKEFTCSAGDMGSIPGLGKSPGEGTGYPLQYSCLVEKEMAVFLPGESCGQRSLVGCCAWGHTESDTTEVT